MTIRLNPTSAVSGTVIAVTDTSFNWASIRTVRPYAEMLEQARDDDGWTPERDAEARRRVQGVRSHLHKRAALRLVTLGVEPTEPGYDGPGDN